MTTKRKKGPTGRPSNWAYATTTTTTIVIAIIIISTIIVVNHWARVIVTWAHGMPAGKEAASLLCPATTV